MLKLYAVSALFAKSSTDFMLFAAAWIAPSDRVATAGAVEIFRQGHPDRLDYKLVAVECAEASPEQIDVVKAQGGNEPVNLQLVRPNPEQPVPAPDGAA